MPARPPALFPDRIRAAIALFALLVSIEPASSAAEPAKPTFARDVAPLVGKYCARCHGTVKPKGGISLVKDTDDGAVLKNREQVEMARALVEFMDQGVYKSEGVLAGEESFARWLWRNGPSTARLMLAN